MLRDGVQHFPFGVVQSNDEVSRARSLYFHLDGLTFGSTPVKINIWKYIDAPHISRNCEQQRVDRVATPKSHGFSCFHAASCSRRRGRLFSDQPSTK